MPWALSVVHKLDMAPVAVHLVHLVRLPQEHCSQGFLVVTQHCSQHLVMVQLVHCLLDSPGVRLRLVRVPQAHCLQGFVEVPVQQVQQAQLVV